MLAIPVPRKHHKSFHFTLSPSLLKITIMTAMRMLVTMARKITTSMDVKPHGFMERTSKPMHPHKIPAANTHSGERIDFLLFLMLIEKILNYFNPGNRHWMLIYRLCRLIHKVLNLLCGLFIGQRNNNGYDKTYNESRDNLIKTGIGNGKFFHGAGEAAIPEGIH